MHNTSSAALSALLTFCLRRACSLIVPASLCPRMVPLARLPMQVLIISYETFRIHCDRFK